MPQHDQKVRPEDDNLNELANEAVEAEPIETGWKNPPKLSDLKADLEEAGSHHNAHITDVNGWLDNLNVTGKARISYRRGRSQIVPKLIRKQAEWRYASLSESFLSHENLFDTEPATFADVDAAKQNGLVLNNQWNTKLDKVAFIDEFVRAGVDEGSMVIRVGWEFEEEDIQVPNIVAVPVTDDFMIRVIEQGVQMLMQNGPQVTEQQLPPDVFDAVQLSMEKRTPTQFMQRGTKASKRTIINQPTIEVCDYAAVVIDPTCKGILKNAEFIIYKFETSKGELERDGRYHNLDSLNIARESTTTKSSESYHNDDASGFQFKDDPRKKLEAFEYWGFWDYEGTGIPKSFVSTWIGEVMIRLEESPFPENELPFVLVKYLPKRKSVYGEPDGALLEDNQKIAGAVTRGMIDIMGRSAAGQVAYRKDALDVTNQRKFDAGLDYSFNAGIDPRMAFHTHVYPEIPQSAQFMLGLQNNEAEALTGVKAFHGGITGAGLGDSATAARSALDAAGKRELGILRRLASGIVEIGRKITAMNAVFLSEEEIVRITDEEFVTIARDDLAGRFDIKLKISTAEADDKKAQELAFMLQTVGNNMPQEYSQMIMEDIATLRKMPELAKRIEQFEPKPDPRAEKLADLEIEKLEAEINKLKSETIENLAEATLDEAQAEKATSEKDNLDLEFVETESGTKQARDLEKGTAQAAGNIALEREKQRGAQPTTE